MNLNKQSYGGFMAPAHQFCRGLLEACGQSAGNGVRAAESVWSHRLGLHQHFVLLHVSRRHKSGCEETSDELALRCWRHQHAA
jgi:hypothetical protein